MFSGYVLQYLEKGRFSELLKQYKVIAIGFVDSELNILYKEVRENGF